MLREEEPRLRPVRPRDASVLYRLRMHPRDRRMFRDDRPVRYEAHRAMLGHSLAAQRSRDCWFAIETDGGEILGAVALYAFSANGRACEWGRFILDRRRRRAGWGRHALTMLMRFARDLGVRTLRCEVLSSNRKALRLYRQLGFRLRSTKANGSGRTFLVLTAALGDVRKEEE